MWAKRLLLTKMALAAVCLAGQLPWAQSVYGSFKGRVTDVFGHPISRVRVSLTSLGKATKTFKDPLVTVYADNTSQVKMGLVEGNAAELVTGTAANKSRTCLISIRTCRARLDLQWFRSDRPRTCPPPGLLDGADCQDSAKITSVLEGDRTWHGPILLVWSAALDIYLVDGTYELFRHYYALPPARERNGREVAAVRGVLASVLGMINGGAAHIAAATDHVIESFRNGLWPGYKTGEGIEPDLLAQFPLLEEVLTAAGVLVWPMVEFEADDALAAGAIAAAADKRVDRVIICTPDKDLAQCVRGSHIVQLNRRTRTTLDEAAIVQKFGVSPASIPDYLALVGDTADGYPGLPGWGAKSSAAVLAKFLHLESIPKDCREWRVNVANASALADTLWRDWDRAVLFRRLATLRTDIRLFADVDELRWRGPTSAFDELAARLDAARTDRRRPAEGSMRARAVRSAVQS